MTGVGMTFCPLCFCCYWHRLGFLQAWLVYRWRRAAYCTAFNVPDSEPRLSRLKLISFSSAGWPWQIYLSLWCLVFLLCNYSGIFPAGVLGGMGDDICGQCTYWHTESIPWLSISSWNSVLFNTVPNVKGLVISSAPDIKHLPLLVIKVYWCWIQCPPDH